MTRRLSGLEEDEAAHKKEIEDDAKSWFPGASEVKLESLTDWEAEDKPIQAKFSVKVEGFASSTGSRLLLPSSVFASAYRRTFDHEKRKYPVYFDYPYVSVDATVIKLPADVAIESLPAKKSEKEDFAYYIIDRKSPKPGYLRLDRTVMVGGIIFKVEDYPKLRTFFGKLKAEDDQQVLLKTSDSSAMEAGHASAH